MSFIKSTARVITWPAKQLVTGVKAGIGWEIQIGLFRTVLDAFAWIGREAQFIRPSAASSPDRIAERQEKGFLQDMPEGEELTKYETTMRNMLFIFTGLFVLFAAGTIYFIRFSPDELMTRHCIKAFLVSLFFIVLFGFQFIKPVKG